MPISEARRRANLRNAQKSTGPKTVEGKQHSRANAIKHGLSASILVAPEEAQSLEDRTATWAVDDPFKNENERWMREQMILATVRIDRCQEEKRLLRSLEADRALLCWEQDHTRDAEILGAKLGKNPSRVAAELRCSRAGVDWLLRRWEKLAAMLDNGTIFEDDQRQLVLNLLGEPIETRSSDLTSLAADSAEELRAMIRSEVDVLQGLRDGALSAIETVHRQMAEAGYPPVESPAMRRLSRYEAEHWKRYHKAVEALEDPQATQAAKTSSNQPSKEKATKPINPVPPAGIETLDALLAAEQEIETQDVNTPPPATKLEPALAISAVPAAPKPLGITVSRTAKPLNRKQRKALQKQMRQGK